MVGYGVMIKRDDEICTKTVGGRNTNINMKTDNNVQNCDRDSFFFKLSFLLASWKHNLMLGFIISMKNGFRLSSLLQRLTTVL